MSNPNDSLLGALIEKIPGYGAYRGEQSRRDDDRKTREFLATRLQECKSGLDACGAAAVKLVQLDRVTEIETLRDDVDRARSRILAAVEGYASWWGEKVVDEAVLSRVVEMDHGLVSTVDRVDAAIQSVGESSESWDAKMLTELVGGLHDQIDRRNAILQIGM